MKVSYKLLVPAFLAGLLLIGCGQDVAAPAEEVMEEAAEAAGDMAESAGDMVEEAVSNEPGGYVPTEDELITGETR